MCLLRCVQISGDVGDNFPYSPWSHHHLSNILKQAYELLFSHDPSFIGIRTLTRLSTCISKIIMQVLCVKKLYCVRATRLTSGYKFDKIKNRSVIKFLQLQGGPRFKSRSRFEFFSWIKIIIIQGTNYRFVFTCQFLFKNITINK